MAYYFVTLNVYPSAGGTLSGSTLAWQDLYSMLATRYHQQDVEIESSQWALSAPAASATIWLKCVSGSASQVALAVEHVTFPGTGEPQRGLEVWRDKVTRLDGTIEFGRASGFRPDFEEGSFSVTQVPRLQEARPVPVMRNIQFLSEEGPK
jgi:hypothetical protein